MKKLLIESIVCFVALLSVLLTGCENMFEAEVSTNVKTSDVLESGYPGALMLMRGSYHRLGNVADDISVHLAIASDDADETNGHTSSADFDMGNWVPSNPEYNILYAGLHDARAQADRFLNMYLPSFNLNVNYGGGNVPVETRRNTMTAYSRLMRGWSTLYIGLIFKETNYYSGPRVASEDALRRAIEDFKAINSLYALTSNTAESVFENISIKEAANTLMAKAYLQLGKYDSAIVAAQKGFLRNTRGSSGASDGTIMMFYNYNPSNLSEIEGNLIYNHVGNKTVQPKNWSINKWFIQNDSLDMRITLDTLTSTNAKYTFSASNDRSNLTGYVLGYKLPYIPAKFTATTVQGKGLRVLSWQDNALIWAESLIKKGDIAGGIAKLNEVRQTALKDKGGAVLPRNISSQQEAIDDVLWERRVEFYCEFGDRFITLRRSGIKHEVSNAEYALPLPITE